MTGYLLREIQQKKLTLNINKIGDHLWTVILRRSKAMRKSPKCLAILTKLNHNIPRKLSQSGLYDFTKLLYSGSKAHLPGTTLTKILT